MRFVVDAQLPQRLAARLISLGHDAVHVKDLPKAGGTSDAEIAAFADRHGRIVVTKDIDFSDTHLAHGEPRQLLRVTTGNIRNDDLLSLIERNLGAICQAFSVSDHVELSPAHLVVHPRRES